MKQKINIRLSIIALVAILATVIGSVTVYYRLFQDRVNRSLRTDAHLLLETGIFQSARVASPDEKTVSTASLQRLQTENLRITWIAEEGRVLFDNRVDPAHLDNHSDRPEVKEAVQAGEGWRVRHSDTQNVDIYYYATRMQDGTILRVATQAETITRVFLQALPVILGISAAVFVLCIAIGHALTKQLLRPIERLVEHLDGPPMKPPYRELAPLVDRIRTQHENILATAKMRQDFTASVSHELKTPLTSISGYAELIENRMVRGEEEIRMARVIRENAARLLVLINDIIQLSNLDHNEIPREFQRVELFELAKSVCRGLQMSAETKRITLRCTGTDVVVNGVPELLKEMVENLVQNAIRYNYINGYVHVRVMFADGRPCLCVKDNGIGIPEEEQKRVFERFYRVNKSRSLETGGTGLGLAIVKHIANIHHARITLKSALRRGTEITVSFEPAVSSELRKGGKASDDEQ